MPVHLDRLFYLVCQLFRTAHCVWHVTELRVRAACGRVAPRVAMWPALGDGAQPASKA